MVLPVLLLAKGRQGSKLATRTIMHQTHVMSHDPAFPITSNPTVLETSDMLSSAVATALSGCRLMLPGSCDSHTKACDEFRVIASLVTCRARVLWELLSSLACEGTGCRWAGGWVKSWCPGNDLICGDDLEVDFCAIVLIVWACFRNLGL